MPLGRGRMGPELIGPLLIKLVPIDPALSHPSWGLAGSP